MLLFHVIRGMCSCQMGQSETSSDPTGVLHCVLRGPYLLMWYLCGRALLKFSPPLTELEILHGGTCDRPSRWHAHHLCKHSPPIQAAACCSGSAYWQCWPFHHVAVFSELRREAVIQDRGLLLYNVCSTTLHRHAAILVLKTFPWN